MPTAKVVEAIDQLTESNKEMAINYILFLKARQDNPESKNVSRRIGIGKGLLDIPDDLDECNEEIAELFGV